MQIATIKVSKPFPILRATLPLPVGQRWEPNHCPFEVVTSTGEVCETQWERVARDEKGGPRVVEIIARVPPVTGAATYSVVTTAGARDRNCKPLPFARSMLDQVFLCFGTDQRPLEWGSYFRNGSVCATRRFSGLNFFGWITVFDGLDVVWLDLVVHNALPGSATIGFDMLSLRAAQPNLAFLSSWPELNTGAGPLGYALVKPRADGKKHALEPRGWRIFQGALFNPNDGAAQTVASALCAGGGWGVADTWTNVDAWQPHALRLPDLSYRSNELATTLRGEWAKIYDALAAGAPFGMGSLDAGALDWRHPWGPKYGGVTGGAYRSQWGGVETVATGEFAGVLELRARLRMIADRCPVAIVDDDGTPEFVEDWLVNGQPKGNWSMSAADAKFDANKDGAFGWSHATGAVPANELAPEHATLLQFSPIDFQHGDRATKPAESLVWLVNDPIARWWVTMSAELWRMSQHAQKRLANEVLAVHAAPHKGCGFGRADGIGWENVAAAYCISASAPARARFNSDCIQFVQTMLSGQMPSGLFRHEYMDKQAKAPPFGDGNFAAWAITKGTEEALLTGALFALARTVEALDDMTTLAVYTALQEWTVVGLAFLAIPNNTVGFSDYVSVVPVTWHTPTGGYPTAILGTPVVSPAAAVRYSSDRSELASTLGCVMLWQRIEGITHDPAQLAAAKRWAGNAANVLGWMMQQTAYKLELDDCAPLHAALQMP